MRRFVCLVAVSVAWFTTGCIAGETDGDSAVAAHEDAFTDTQALGPVPTGQPAKYPIILAHGFLASPTKFGSFNHHIPEALKADGHKVFVGDVPPFAPVKDRAQYLAQQVDE